jgi:hypothetical protein
MGAGFLRVARTEQTSAIRYLRQRVDNTKTTRYLHQAMTHLDFALLISRLADLACAFAI